MAMDFSIPDCFMIAFFCGALFGLFYELLRIVRRLFPLNAVTFVCDICFFIVAAFVVLGISLYLGNYVRIYTLLGFAAGIFAYIQTIGRLLSALEMLVVRCLKTFAKALYNVLAARVGAFAHKIKLHFGKINDFFADKAKKAFSLLQFKHQKLYNKKRNITTSIDDAKNGEIFGGKNVIHAKIYRSK